MNGGCEADGPRSARRHRRLEVVRLLRARAAGGDYAYGNRHERDGMEWPATHTPLHGEPPTTSCAPPSAGANGPGETANVRVAGRCSGKPAACCTVIASSTRLAWR